MCWENELINGWTQLVRSSCSSSLPPCCTCQRRRGHWRHLGLSWGGGVMIRVRRQLSVGKFDLSPAVNTLFKTNSAEKTCLLKWQVELLCRAAASSCFPSNIQDFWWILNRLQVKEWGFRGRIRSSEMGNMILMALLLVHLPTGEALRAAYETRPSPKVHTRY